jgi:hypothetical protein
LGNPLNWIVNKLNPAVKPRTKETDQQAKQKLAEKGQLGLFETVPSSVAQTDMAVAKPKKKFTEVTTYCPIKLMINASGSINILLQTSKCRIES